MGKHEEEEKVGTKKGVRRGPVKVQFRETNMKLKSVSKSEFLDIRKKDNIANEAARKARAQSLAESAGEEKEVDEEDPIQAAEKRVADVKSAITKARKSLEAKPKDKNLTKKLATLETELDEAEDELEKLND